MADLVKARATAKMQGVVAGEVVQVNPADPHIAKLLRARLLVIESSVPEKERADVNDEA